MTAEPSYLAALFLLAACTSPKPAAPPAESVRQTTPTPPEPPPKPVAEKELAVADDAEFADLVERTYDVQYSKLDDAGKKARNRELDAFWKKVQDDPKRWVPALRHELDDPTHPSFFFHDGAYLLFTLSKEPEDRERILAALTRVDAEDLQPRIFVGMVIELANEGFDTAPAAFRLLEKPDFKLFLPDHFITVGRDIALLPMLLPTKPEYVVPAVEKRFATETDVAAKRSLLLVAWYAVTAEGDAFIRRVAADPAQPHDVADGAKKIVAQFGAAEGYDPKVLEEWLYEEKLPDDGATARELRRDYLRGISDGTIPVVDGLTMLMRKLGEPKAR